MRTSPPLASSLALLLGLTACSPDVVLDAKPDADLRRSQRVSIRVAGFVEAAGIT